MTEENTVQSAPATESSRAAQVTQPRGGSQVVQSPRAPAAQPAAGPVAGPAQGPAAAAGAVVAGGGRRLALLDVLRGLAALSVVFNHFGFFIPPRIQA